MATGDMTRVLVTGAGGFIGRRVLPLLRKKGVETIALSRSQQPGCVSANLLDSEKHESLLAQAAPTHILHLAWEVTHGSFWTSPDNLVWRDVTVHLARAAQRHGVKRFVGVGTCAEYDWSDDGAQNRKETDALKPNTLYSEAKADCFRALSDLGGAMGFAWGRLFHLFGRDEPPAKLVRAMIDAAREGRALPLKAPAVWRDYMNADHAAAALVALLLSDMTGAMNVATGHAMRLKDIGTLIARALGQTDLYATAGEATGGETLRMIADVARLRAIYAPENAILTREWVQANERLGC